MYKINRLLDLKPLLVLVITLLIHSGIAYSQKTENDLDCDSKFDHLLLFVKDSSIQKSLENIFTLGINLSSHHKNQGTYSRFFIFYNTFIELLYPYDTTKILENQKLFGSQYSLRWNSSDSLCPIAFGFMTTPSDSKCVNMRPYFSRDAPQNEYYLMSEENSNIKQPLVYSSSKERGYKKINKLEEFDPKMNPKYRNDFLQYLSHKSGVQKLSQIVLTVPEKTNGFNLNLVAQQKIVKIVYGKSYSLKLIFDHHKQGKTIVIQNNLPTLPVTIEY